MANKIYTSAALYINNQLLSEAIDLTINFNGNHQRVSTMARGFAGMSKGAPVLEISCNNATPEAGFEFDPSIYINNVQEIKITVFAAGQTLTTKGFIESGSFTKGVDSAASLSMSFVGPPAIWE